MSVRAMSNVFDRQDIKSSTDRFVLLALTDHASDDGENIYPSVETVCRKTGFSERTVQGAIKNLVAIGALVPDGKGKRMTNKYRYTFAPAGDAPLPPQITAFTPAGDAPESLKNHHIKPSKKQSSFPQAELKSMVYVLEQVTGIDQKLQYGKLASYGKKLLVGDYSAEVVARIFAKGGLWYKKTWQGRKGQKPKPNEICDSIKELAGKNDENDPHKYVSGEFADFIEH